MIATARIETADEISERTAIIHERIALAEFGLGRREIGERAKRALAIIRQSHEMELLALVMREDANAILRDVERTRD